MLKKIILQFNNFIRHTQTTIGEPTDRLAYIYFSPTVDKTQLNIIALSMYNC